MVQLIIVRLRQQIKVCLFKARRENIKRRIRRWIHQSRSALDHIYPVTNLSTRVNEIIASGLKIGNLVRYNRNHKNQKKSTNDWKFNLFINPEKLQRLWWLLFTNVWVNKLIETRMELNRTIIHNINNWHGQLCTFLEFTWFSAPKTLSSFMTNKSGPRKPIQCSDRISFEVGGLLLNLSFGNTTWFDST